MGQSLPLWHKVGDAVEAGLEGFGSTTNTVKLGSATCIRLESQALLAEIQPRLELDTNLRKDLVTKRSGRMTSLVQCMAKYYL